MYSNYNFQFLKKLVSFLDIIDNENNWHISKYPIINLHWVSVSPYKEY
jgi:hypothetical protein